MIFFAITAYSERCSSPSVQTENATLLTPHIAPSLAQQDFILRHAQIPSGPIDDAFGQALDISCSVMGVTERKVEG